MAVAVIRNNQEEINNFLKTPKQFSNDEARVNDYLGDNLGLTPSDVGQACKSIIELTAKFMEIANANPDNPIGKVLEAANNETNEKDPKLVRFVMMNFIPHAPTINLRVPSIVNRASDGPGEDDAASGVSVSKKKGTSITASGSVLSTEPPVQNETEDVEKLLDWYKKDPNFNEHHEYLQMLERLYAEHLKTGVPLAKSLENYQDLILGKSKSKPNDNDNTPFGIRSPNLKLDDLDKGWSVDNMESPLKNSGQRPDGSEITSNLLGATIDVNKKDRKHNGPSRDSSQSSDPNRSRTNEINAPPVNIRKGGSSRDSGDIDTHLQDTYDFSDAPPVNIRKGDIILVSKDKLPIDHGAAQDKEATTFGEKTFGGTNFDQDLTNNELVAHELQTKVKTKERTMTKDSVTTLDTPREYYYYFRVENTSPTPLDATFRVFLVPEEFAQSRHHWIEVDKFKQTLPSKSKTVVCRDCDMSSVIRQPPQKTLNGIANQSSVRESMMEKLPRERKEGVKFKLLLLITDWSLDEIPTLSRCGRSISFCGAETLAYKYPDNRPIGYPFDGPFKNNSYEETFKVHNATIKDIIINWAGNISEIDVKA